MSMLVFVFVFIRMPLFQRSLRCLPPPFIKSPRYRVTGLIMVIPLSKLMLLLHFSGIPIP
jgi:hypothetical protein